MLESEDNRMASGEQEVDISDRDVWDDSTLIRHWDASLAEYKKYHSLEAQGQAGPASVTERSDVEMEQHGVKQPNVEPQEQVQHEEEEEEEILGEGDNEENDETNTTQQGPVISLDNLDDGMKQLAMAWYWAGYYHGLEVGKKRAS